MRRVDTRRLNLIGCRVMVRSSSNQALEGITGIVMDETKNTLLLKGASGRLLRIPKAPCLFEVEVEGEEGKVLVDGRSIIGRLDRRLTGR